MKRIIIAALLCFITQITCAQISVSVKAGKEVYLGNYYKPTVLGLSFESTEDEENGLRYSLEYYLPFNYTEDVSGQALSNFTIPQEILVRSKSVVNGFAACLHSRNYLGHGDYDFGGTYLLWGASTGLLFTKTKYNFGNYDPNNYTVTGFDNDEPTYINLLVKGQFGSGYEVNINGVKLFAEGVIGLNLVNGFINNDNGATLSLAGSVTAGVRLFGK